MIKLQQLQKYFNRRKRNEIHVINDISLDLPEKGLVVLLGPSGSGKTTLLNVLGGLDSVQSGSITFDEKVIKGYHANTWDQIRNEHVGYIFQNYNLLPDLSVFDNIAFVLKMMGINDDKIIESRVHYILNAVNMYPFRKKKATQLSGGQQQRVAIARAIVKNPKVVIADEPTGNLDSKNTLDIMNIIKQISEQTLVVLVTHEKHIAELYADRIITLKDGKIMTDEENTSDHSHHFGPDETIYLKDLKKVDGQINENLKVNYFSDQEETEPIEVKLILKNKTLYLDVDSQFNNIKLVEKGSSINIKDAHYVKKTRAQLMETSFNREEIDNSNVVRQRHLMVSIKQSLWLAVKKILQTTRRGKIMIFAFAVAGMVIAASISMFATAVIIDPEPNMALSEGYVRVSKGMYLSEEDVDYLYSLSDIDSSYYVNPYGYFRASFVTPQNTSANLGLSNQINLFKDLDERDIEKGSLPESGTQGILVTRAVADSILTSSSGQDFGIWNDEALLNEYVRFGDHLIPITGIVDSGISMIYMDESLALTYILYQYMSEIGAEAMLIDSLSASDIIAGTLPTDDSQYVFSQGYMDTLSIPSVTFPITFGDITISGVASGTEDVIYVSEDMVYKGLLTSTTNTYIHSENPEQLITQLNEDNELDVTISDVYQIAYDSLRSQQRLILASSLTTFAVLIGASLIGFYFVIRSSLISRIYEISVYRALGVHKKDIFSSFLIEISILTTVSTLVGYILATMLLSRLSQGLLGEFNFLLVTPLTIGAGIIMVYGLNILAGILPVYLLLRKTPAQILSQYDI